MNDAAFIRSLNATQRQQLARRIANALEIRPETPLSEIVSGFRNYIESVEPKAKQPLDLQPCKDA